MVLALGGIITLKATYFPPKIDPGFLFRIHLWDHSMLRGLVVVISLLSIPIIVLTQLLRRRDPVFNLDEFYPLQVLDVLCCENKPRYDKEKSSGEDIAIADVVGAPVRYDRFFIGWSFSYFWC